MATYDITSGVTSTGLILGGDTLNIFGGVAIDTTVNSGGVAYVFRGGVASDTTVNSGGEAYVFPGGTASSVTVNYGGYLNFSGDTGKIIENGGYVYLAIGANATVVPNTISGLMLENTSATVHKNTTATDIKLNTCGELGVSSGGILNRATVNYGGSLFIFSGGTASNAAVNSGGYMYVSSGATVTEILENGGYVNVDNGANVKFKANNLSGLVLEGTRATVHSGTTADKFTLNSNGILYVSGGILNRATVNWKGQLYVNLGGKADKVTVKSGGSMDVRSGGTANDIMIESGGGFYVSVGKADKVTVKSGGYMYVSSGGTATGVEWTPCEGLLGVYAGATVKFKNKLSGVYYGSDSKQLEHAAAMDGRTLGSDCEMVVMNGGTANNATVNDGTIRVYSGGRADNALNSGGYIYVYSGGAADHATLKIGGYMYLAGATANDTMVERGARLYIETDGIAKNTTLGGSMTISSGGTAKRVVMSGRASLVIGGTAFGVDWTPCEGYIQVSRGGSVTYRNSSFSGVYFGDGSLLSHNAVMDGKTLNNYYYEMYVYSGGTASNTTLNGGRMYVCSGGRAANTNVFSGIIYLRSGGSVNGGTVEGQDCAIDIIGGSANGIALKSGGRMNVASGGMVNNTTVSSGGYLYIHYDGTASNTTVSSGGSMAYYFTTRGRLETVRIKSGGTANISGTMEDITAEFGARVTLGGSAHHVKFGGGVTSSDMEIRGTVNDFTLEGKNANIASGGVVEQAAVNGLLYVSGLVNGAVINSGGGLMISDVGSANNVTVSEGGVLVDYGSGSGVTIQNKGIAIVSSGGTATNVTVLTGGILGVIKDGVLTGSMTFATGTTIGTDAGAKIDFDVSKRTSADCSNPLLNDLSVITGSPDYTLTVSAVQGFGTYTLAGQASGFSGTIAVLDENGTDTGCALSVGSTADIFGASHTLKLVNESLVLTVGESENMEPADTGWNDTLYDKKTKTLNRSVYDMDALAVTADTRELLIDTAGTVRALEDQHNFTGNSNSGKLDAADFTKIELATAAKLSFNLYSGQAAKFTVWQLVEGKDKKGATTYTMKSLQSTTLKGGYAGVSTSKKPLLLEAGEYYVSMELSNAKKAGEDGYYSVMIDDSPSATEFYTQAINYDDGDDMKTRGPSGHFTRLGTITEDNLEGALVSDDWVGFSDSIDYMQFTLESAAKLGFHVSATDATKFTVWQLNEKTDKIGVKTYSLKSLQSVTLKKEGVNDYWANTSGKPLILDAGTYYLSMESTNAKKGGSATYSISLSGAEFYHRCDNGDDWGDMKTDGAYGLVGDAGTLSAVGVILEDWVGYGDAIDYKEFTLNRKTSLSFSVHAEDDAKFTVWRLDGKTNKKGVTTYSLKALGSVRIAAGNTERTQGFNLDAGAYYFSMESVNAKKGASCDYTVELASFVESNSLSAALAMPETDALADVASFALDLPDGKSAWQSLLA